MSENEDDMIPRNFIESFDKAKQECIGSESDVVFEERGDKIQISEEEKIVERYPKDENVFGFYFSVW